MGFLCGLGACAHSWEELAFEFSLCPVGVSPLGQTSLTQALLTSVMHEDWAFQGGWEQGLLGVRVSQTQKSGNSICKVLGARSPLCVFQKFPSGRHVIES